MFKGTQLEDDYTLDYYDIQKAAVIHLVLRQRMQLVSSMARRKPEKDAKKQKSNMESGLGGSYEVKSYEAYRLFKDLNQAA